MRITNYVSFQWGFCWNWNVHSLQNNHSLVHVFVDVCVNMFVRIFPWKVESCNLTLFIMPVYQFVCLCVTLHLHNNVSTARQLFQHDLWGNVWLYKFEYACVWNPSDCFLRNCKMLKSVWLPSDIFPLNLYIKVCVVCECVRASVFPRRTPNPVSLTSLFLVVVPGGSSGDSTFPTLLLDPPDSSSPRP